MTRLDKVPLSRIGALFRTSIQDSGIESTTWTLNAEIMMNQMISPSTLSYFYHLHSFISKIVGQFFQNSSIPILIKYTVIHHPTFTSNPRNPFTPCFGLSSLIISTGQNGSFRVRMNWLTSGPTHPFMHTHTHTYKNSSLRHI